MQVLSMFLVCTQYELGNLAKGKWREAKAQIFRILGDCGVGDNQLGDNGIGDNYTRG